MLPSSHSSTPTCITIALLAWVPSFWAAYRLNRPASGREKTIVPLSEWWHTLCLPDEELFHLVDSMTRLSLLALSLVGAFSVLPATSHAQWRLQSPSKEDLYGAWGSSLKDLYMVGANGTILHSQDNGISFTLEAPETKETLYGVGGTSPDNVFVVGANGTLLHSTDRGKTWLPRSFGARTSLRAVWSSPDGYTFVVGEQGAILRSKDGLSWDTLPSNNTGILYSVWGNADAVYVTGEQGAILRSNDKGATWTALTSNTTENLRGVWGDSVGNLFVVGYRGTILHSKDKGATWTAKPSNTQEWLAGVCGFEGVVYAVGAQGLALISTNNGDSWVAQETRLTTPLYAVIAMSPAHAYAVGRKGNIAFRSPVRPLLVLRATDGDTSAEGADAYLDEQPLGKVPLSVEVDTGEHILQLKKEGYRSVVYTINLKEGDVYNLPVRAEEAQVAFLKAVSSVVIEGPAGAVIYLDQERQGVAPMTLTEVTRGPHVLRLEKPGYQQWISIVDVEVQNQPINAGLVKKREAAPAQELGLPTNHPYYKIALAGASVGTVAALSGYIEARRAKDAAEVGEGGADEAIDEIALHQKRASRLGLVSDICFGAALLSGGAGLVIDRLNKRSEATISLTPTGASLQVKF